MSKDARVRKLKDMTADELLSMPDIEYGEPATSITIPRGALGEIRRRLKIIEMMERSDIKTSAAPGPALETIDNLISNILISRSIDELVFRHAEVLAQLYQARALNEVAQSLDELVRDGIGVKRPDDE